MNAQLSVKDFYFCYSDQVAKFLRYEKNINFVTKAIHPKSMKMFYLFIRNNVLEQALKEYSETDQD